MSDLIKSTLIQELTSPVPEAISSFADYIAQKMEGTPLGILFFGSVLREMDPEGIVDFYVITDGPASLGNAPLEKLANRMLPPNVYYMEHEVGGKCVRAKVAFLSLKQFLKRSTLFTLDTTIWARFCQPVRLVWVKDAVNAEKILQAIRQCLITAGCWAALLGPESGEADIYWHNLFTYTYAAELRVEKKGRSRNILAGKEERYRVLLPATWTEASLEFEEKAGVLHPVLSFAARQKAAHNWRNIAAAGRPLNIARLIKAAFTFRDGVSYLLWKIRRHTGHDVYVSDFEKRHPILTLPLFLWRVRHVRSRQR